MSNLEDASSVVERDDVTVHKTFEDEDFPVPAIAFDVRAEGPEAVDVTITDVIPPEVPEENIGFHPEYGAEFWSIEGDDIVFERRFDPGETYTTVYGIRPEEVDDVESHLGEPDLSVSRAGDLGGDLTDTDEIGGVDGEIVVDSIDLDEGGGEPPDASDDDGEWTSADDQVGDATVDDGSEPTVPEDSLDVPLDEEGAESSGPEGESVAAALAAEIRAGEVAEAELDALRTALFDAGPEDATSSHDARISHLQAAVDDLQAYTDALEAFIDENGGAAAVVRDLREEIATVEESVEELRERTADNADLTHQVGGDVEELSGDLSALDARIETLESDLERAMAAADTADALDEEVSELSGELAELRTEVTEGEDVDERLAELEDDVAAIRTELEDLAEMRDRMASIFGGSGPDAADSL